MDRGIYLDKMPDQHNAEHQKKDMTHLKDGRPTDQRSENESNAVNAGKVEASNEAPYRERDRVLRMFLDGR